MSVLHGFVDQPILDSIPNGLQQLLPELYAGGTSDRAGISQG